MFKNLGCVFNYFDALNLVYHAVQNIKIRLIKNAACTHTFVHVRFCISSLNSIKHTLHMKPLRTQHGTSTKSYKILSFHACDF